MTLFYIKAGATSNPFEKTIYQINTLSLDMYISMILQYKEHLSKLESEIDALAKQIEEYNISNSINGIGEKIAATIISEIGEIDRLNNPKKLVAFAGIYPSLFEQENLRPQRIESQNEDLADFGMPNMWQSVVPFVIVVKRKQLMKSYLETKDCESFTTRDEKKESHLR